MQPYHNLLKYLIANPVEKENRTGTGTIGVFGYQMRFDLSEGFPLLTTKKVPLKAVIHELLWFLKGSTNIAYLKENGVKIWDHWADAQGEMEPMYGKQWRSWQSPDGQTIDQISAVIQQIQTNPDSRRLVVSAWNVADIAQMKSPPGHALFQFYVAHGKLSCQLYQSSADTFLGLPFNIASYSLLTLMMAQVCHLQPGEFIWTGGDTHLYLNHLEPALTQLGRAPLLLPQMKLNPAITSIFDFTYPDFTLENYRSHPAIKVAV